MKRKEVEDVMGGKDAWANVDKTDGMNFLVPGPVRWMGLFMRERDVG